MDKIYVLAGKAKSGKDLTAKIIKENTDKKVFIYSVTYYLKKYIMQIYNWDGKEATKPRSLLQKLGKEIKTQYPNFFIERMDEDIKFLNDYCDILIITGVRLIKELEFLKKKGAILIKMEKDFDNNLTLEEQEDITEIDVDNYIDYDFIIKNNGNINDLKNNIRRII